MLDESDNGESDSASEDAESGSRVSEGTRSPDHQIEVKRKVDTRSPSDMSTERPTSKPNSDLSSLRRIREDDRKKGKAISRQIASRFTLAVIP